MQEILEAGAQIISKVNPEILDQLADTKRSIRERALIMLTEGLDPQSEKDTLIFQVLPLSLLKSGDLMGAIWSMITMGNLGNTLSWEILSEIYQKTIRGRQECIESGDTESLEVLDFAIESLFGMCQKHVGLKNTAETRMMMGHYEELRGAPYKAIDHYDYVIGKGGITGYMASARVFEILEQYQSSREILETGFHISSDVRILGQLITLLCKMGENKDAYLRYRELQQLDAKGVEPFIIYKGTIENDMELAVLENVIASYITEGSLVPYDPLVNLTQSASEYISMEISKVNDKMENFAKVDVENWKSEEVSEYNECIFRRLKLMQIDLLSLGNGRYLKSYIQDIFMLAINGSPANQNRVSEFFLENFSREVEHELQKRGRINTSTDKETEEPVLNTRPNTVLEDIRWHMSRLGELFSQPEYYVIQEKLLIPTLIASEKKSFSYSDEIAENLQGALFARCNGSNNYYGLRRSIRENYENFIAQFDAKYGVFYRRHVQLMAIDPTVTPEKYPKILEKNTDVALLFWMEKIIAGEFPTNNLKKMDDLVEKYYLNQLSISNTLLLSSLLYSVSMEYALGILVDYPNMLDAPEAIYIITEGLRSMDMSTQKKCIKDLHARTQEEYGARGFFEHIRRTFAFIESDDPSEGDIEMMLLASGNIAILQKKEIEQALINFETASSEFGSLEGLLQLGESLSDKGEYETMMGYFELAFIQNDSIAVVEKILCHAISAGKYDIVEQYVQHGLSRGYNMMNPILALHLWQGKTESALLQAISMINNHQEIIDMPPGLLRLLFDIIDFEINSPELNDGNSDKMKIYASYIFARIHIADQTLDPSLFIGHWQYISSLVNSYEGDRLHELIRDILSPLTGDLDEDDIGSSLPDQSLAYIDTHANKICTTYQYLIDNETDTIKKERLYTLLNKIAENIIVVLRQFPDADEHIEKYRMTMEFQEIEDYKRPNQEDRVPVGYVH